MVRTIKKENEREVICNRCHSLIGYTLEDARLVYDLASDVYYVVDCPECKNEILVNI